MRFKENLKILMKRRNLSQTEFAEILDKTPSNISTWTKGVMPRVNVVLEIAKFFNVTLDDLFYTDLTKKTMLGVEFEEEIIVKVPATEQEPAGMGAPNQLKNQLLQLLTTDPDIILCMKNHFDAGMMQYEQTQKIAEALKNKKKVNEKNEEEVKPQ